MNRIFEILKKYMIFIAILTGISIVLGISYSNFIVTSGKHKAAEMYIGTLKYSMTIDGTTTNTLSVPAGETIIDVTITNENPIDTYYKLIYQNNSNVSIKYYESTKDTNDNVTNYSLPNSKITSNNKNTIKLKITNSSTSSQKVTFKIVGGFATNTLNDITVPTGYTIIGKDTSTNTYFCTTTDTLTQGLKYVNGQYTYAYKQEGDYASSGLVWNSISKNGWGVQLTDKTSTDAVTSKVCTYINNKPITSMSDMFSYSQATTLDLSNSNTSNVTNMDGMFSYSQATTLDLSNFNTSNVTNMNSMFYKSQATTLDLSNFDTSKVTDMNYMFSNSQATTLDLSNFDTSKVTDMGNMFWNSQATTLDVSNFDTSKVTYMRQMFSESQATTLDLSNFNTSKVTNMSSMFSNSQATTLDLSNFNTSKVTYMSDMFYNSQVTTLDVSNFDTSKVTSMYNMFFNSKATTLDVSNFDTSNVTDMSFMFYGTKVTTLDVSNFDTSNVTNMSGMFSSSQVATLDLSSFNTSRVTNMNGMFNDSTLLTTIYASDKFNTYNVMYSTNMFTGCTNLVGGAGTKYNSSYINITYARIDGGTSNPGYFTDIADKPSAFSTDSWSTIISSVKANNKRGYKVGDTKKIDLGTYGTHTLRVANISKSDSCGNSGYSESGCGFVIEFADIITNRVINSTSTTRGSWSATTIRTFVNNDIYNLLPTDLKKGILNTNVITGHGNSEDNNSTSTDKLYLLSPIEIYGSVSTTYDSAINVTNQLDYYKQNNVSLNSYDSAIKNTVVSGGTGSVNAWWTRTPAQIMDGQFMMVTDTGNLYSTYLTQQLGVSPAFRIG